MTEASPPAPRIPNSIDLVRLYAGLCGSAPGRIASPLEGSTPDSAGAGFGLPQAALALQALGLQARLHTGSLASARRGPMPALAVAVDGCLMLVCPSPDGHWQVQRAGEDKPRPLSHDALQALWTRQWLTVQPVSGADTGHQAAQAFGAGWFVQALRPYRGLLGEVLLASLFLQVLALVTPLVFQVVIDKVLTQRTPSTLDVLVMALLLIGLFEGVLGVMRHYLSSHTAHRVDVTLGIRLFRHLLRLPMSYFDNRRPGDTVACVRELDNVRSFLTGPALTSVLDLLFVCVFLAVMAYYSLWLTSVVVIALPVFLALSWALGPTMRRQLDDKHAQGAANQSFLAETVSCIETLKSQAMEPARQRAWEQRLARQASTAFEAGQTAHFAQQAVGFASRVLTVALLWLGARQVMAGELTVGGLIAFNMLASRVTGPLMKLASLWQDITQLRLSLRRVAQVMDAPAESALGAQQAAPPEQRGEVRFESVAFRYGPNLPAVLQDLSFRVGPGEIVGVTGVSGAGKTTLVRLLQRLYVPEQGRILLDGIDLGLLDPSWLRRQVGVVGQDAVIFDLAVRENIALAAPGMAPECVVEAARTAGAHDFIMRLPQGYDTPVGERGARLSGGQRARIAIARALAADPAVLLLDEATAWLDGDSEREFHAHLARLRKGRTLLIVAHRESTLRWADRVLVLEGGRIARIGTRQVRPPPPQSALGREEASVV